ncbi:conserved hypothetical protein [Thermoproteus tenax Kra 1]|uniref:Uncharacterized protein n=1 Tax=Thermoproteus tenax (strain ATCC 35583 / DSM 2078 / JCM 9277 / NBRC 100435 / Kra 1) TaxID=768679 RepID=G4RKB6_THETK|nr:conserved hypothetical protein [Thermoproteus tenax Kra 1]
MIAVLGANARGLPGIREIKSLDELASWELLVVVGDRDLAERVGAAFFTREEWNRFLEVYAAELTKESSRRIDQPPAP